MATPVLIFCGISGTLLRILLFYTGIPAWLRERKEVVTPLTSWERVLEGISLQKRFISPYSGDIFHETPLLLRCLRLAEHIPGGSQTIFIVVDIVIGILLHKIANEFSRSEYNRQNRELSKYSPKAKSLLISGRDIVNLPIAVSVVHFFGPYSIATCLAQSTGVFTNLAVLFCWLYTLKGNVLLSCLSLAVAAYQSLYPAVFIIPVATHLFLTSNPKPDSFTSKAAIQNYTRTVLVFAVCLAGLLGASFSLEGSWAFLRSTYGFILGVPDLTPNVGVFWYFFTEMFEHFRIFFVCVFQINTFIYSIPLAIKLRERPLFQLYVAMFLVSIFKSYPSYADTALYLSLLPLWRHVFGYLRNMMVVSVMYMVVAVVAPILWHLWIYAASANANFYFAITLTFSTAQIFLLTDLLYAFLRYEYDLKHGIEHFLPNGKKTSVMLD
ncbi:phosphatidylinositol glycan anchor biosynthesis class U protein-like [Littorina saxatilis]|uniref:phosphatidylinositol glycan anchor biosynthesis class U protein-like n=1 Tax=Littorina saxatilis TaxID=31220 RepID=UPI0038B6391B